MIPSRLAVSLALLASTPTIGVAQGADTLWRVVPGRRAGPVTLHTTVETLRAAVGARNVSIVRLDIGEGETEPGVILFPTDPRRRAFVYWRDTLSFKAPVGVVLRDSATIWKLPVPITIGTSMAELERLNGKPFNFSGFDWDYGGRTGDWNEGRLSTAFGAGFGLVVSFDKGCRPNLSDAQWSEVLGDRQVSSSNKTARALCPCVGEISIGITPP